jgi:putative flippase GtrA
MYLKELLRLLRFGAVGLFAGAIHYWVVIALVELTALSPLQANFGGFAAAFWGSYLGHRYWTFADHRLDRASSSFFRFLATALLGFAINHALFYLLLQHTRLPYFISLAIVVAVVAVLTYFLSRLWAFRTHQSSLP